MGERMRKDKELKERAGERAARSAKQARWQIPRA